MKEPEISFVHDNMLRVDGKMLWADVLPVPDSRNHEIVTPDKFLTVLEIGHKAIGDTLGSVPLVWGLRLSTDPDTEGRESRKVLTPEGWDNKNSGWLYDKSDIIEDFHPYWDAVSNARFSPQIGLASGKALGGAWLMMKDDRKT